MSIVVLAGDIGGTKTWLRLARHSAQQSTCLHEQRYASAAYPRFELLLADFLSSPALSGLKPLAACLAVAGPIQAQSDRQQAQITNLPWLLDSQDLSRQCGQIPVRLINDFEGIGHGIATLHDTDLAVLQTGTATPGAPRLLVGAGTGLGCALLLPQSGTWRVLATEAGHSGFAPENAQQRALLEYLSVHHQRVTYEHLLSGAGLLRLYQFCRDSAAWPSETALAQAVASADDPAAAISQAALQGHSALAQASLDLFVRIYGSLAGNLALGCLPYDGIFIAGGIAPKILPALQQGEFITALTAKAPMAEVLTRMPVTVVLNEKTGLLGAVQQAVNALS